MPRPNDDVQFINDGLRAIDRTLTYADPAVQEQDAGITVGQLKPSSIINNTAYHDYYRIELGTPVITTQVPDVTLTKDLSNLLDIVSRLSDSFGLFATTAEPTEADDVEELLAEIGADLDAMAAGPIPENVSWFVSRALGDYLEQPTWTALNAGKRDRLVQLAAAWAALIEKPASAESAATATTTGRAGPLETVRERVTPILDALNSLIDW